VVSSELAIFCGFLDGRQMFWMASGWLRTNFAVADQKSRPSAATHQLTTRKFANFFSNLKKNALHRPGTKFGVECLEATF